MNHRIRAAAIGVDAGKLLKVMHDILEQGKMFWILSGGGVEREESPFDCAKREVMGEIGMHVNRDRVIYVRQRADTELDYHHVELFILVKSFCGKPAPGDNSEISPFTFLISDARFLARDEMHDVGVYPEMLKNQFWDRLNLGFPQMTYLGVDKD